jgi:hypothetical protein
MILARITSQYDDVYFLDIDSSVCRSSLERFTLNGLFLGIKDAIALMQAYQITSPIRLLDFSSTASTFQDPFGHIETISVNRAVSSDSASAIVSKLSKVILSPGRLRIVRVSTFEAIMRRHSASPATRVSLVRSEVRVLPLHWKLPGDALNSRSNQGPLFGGRLLH